MKYRLLYDLYALGELAVASAPVLASGIPILASSYGIYIAGFLKSNQPLPPELEGLKPEEEEAPQSLDQQLGTRRGPRLASRQPFIGRDGKPVEIQDEEFTDLDKKLEEIEKETEEIERKTGYPQPDSLKSRLNLIDQYYQGQQFPTSRNLDDGGIDFQNQFGVQGPKEGNRYPLYNMGKYIADGYMEGLNNMLNPPVLNRPVGGSGLGEEEEDEVFYLPIIRKAPRKPILKRQTNQLR